MVKPGYFLIAGAIAATFLGDAHTNPKLASLAEQVRVDSVRLGKGISPLTACVAGTAQCQATYTGNIGLDSCATSDSVYGVGYEFNGTAGERLTLSSSSPSFAMTIAVFDGHAGNSTIYGQAQAPSAGSAAQISSLSLPYTGPYVIILSPLAPFTFGNYSLTLNCATSGYPPPYPPPSSNLCTPDSKTACMLNNRFKVTVRYRSVFDNAPVDTDALLKPVSGFASSSYETAFFYFNSPNNIEMLVKLLDQGNKDSQGRPTIAVLFGTATPLRTQLTITDTVSGTTKQYTSAFGSMQGTTDFSAFVK